MNDLTEVKMEAEAVGIVKAEAVNVSKNGFLLVRVGSDSKPRQVLT